MNSQIQNKKHAEETGENTCKLIRTHASYEQQVFPLSPSYFTEHVVWKERPEIGHLLVETVPFLFNFYAGTIGICASTVTKANDYQCKDSWSPKSVQSALKNMPLKICCYQF